MARDKIFISYRRDDARADARSIYAQLESEFGRERIFMDVDTIQPGKDFRKVLDTSLSETRALLVLIGERWNAGDRLSEPNDFVRLEIKHALDSDIDVFPVLLDNTPMPSPGDLPEDIRDLVYRQGLKVRHDTFGSDMLNVLNALRPVSVAPQLPKKRRSASRSRTPLLVGGLAVVAAAAAWAFYPSMELGLVEQPDDSVFENSEVDEGEAERQNDSRRLAEENETTRVAAAWEIVKSTSDIDTVHRFRENNPGSAFDADAVRLLDELYQIEWWDQLHQSHYVEDWREYLNQFPEGLFSKEAHSKLSEFYTSAQEDLKKLGFYGGKIDGRWGQASKLALQTFQERAGISPASGELTSVALQALAEAAKVLSVPTDHKKFRDCGVCPEMVVVPGGSFTMGSPENEADRRDHEGPQRRVLIAAFAAGKFEVTFAEWDACVSEGGCSHEPDDKSWGRGSRPVINVSWEDAQTYVRWLSGKTGESYRLLTEAEWEYAARAGTTTRYSFLDEVTSRQANYERAVGKTQPVGSYPANRFGLHDMHGNVWEWVQDCWHKSYHFAPTDGSAWMNAAGGDCSRAVLRGGSWGSPTRALRSAFRYEYLRYLRSHGNGFRVSRTLGN